MVGYTQLVWMHNLVARIHISIKKKMFKLTNILLAFVTNSLVFKMRHVCKKALVKPMSKVN